MTQPMIDGYEAEKHPLVTGLLKGIFNERPLKGKLCKQQNSLLCPGLLFAYFDFDPKPNSKTPFELAIDFALRLDGIWIYCPLLAASTQTQPFRFQNWSQDTLVSSSYCFFLFNNGVIS